MEEKLVSPKAYIKARIIETLDDIDVAIHMWIAGRSRNSAGRVFSAVKALLSALVTKNRDWYANRGYNAPTHSFHGFSQVRFHTS